MGEIYIDNSIVEGSKPLHARVLAYSPEPTKEKHYSIISAHEDNSVMANYYNVDVLKLSARLYTHDAKINALEVLHTPSDKHARIVTASIDGQIQLAQLCLQDTFEHSVEILQPSTNVQVRANTFLFLQQTGMLISGHQNGEIKFWNTHKDTPLVNRNKATIKDIKQPIIDLQYCKISDVEFIFVTTVDNQCHMIKINSYALGSPYIKKIETPLSFSQEQHKSSWCNIAISDDVIAYVDTKYKLRLGRLQNVVLSHTPIIMNNTEQSVNLFRLLDIAKETPFHIEFKNTAQGLLLVLWSWHSPRFVVLKIDNLSASVYYKDELQPGNICDSSIVDWPQMCAFTLHSNGLIKPRIIGFGRPQVDYRPINGRLASIASTMLNCDGTIMVTSFRRRENTSLSLYSTATGKPYGRGTIQSADNFTFTDVSFDATDPNKLFVVSHRTNYNMMPPQGLNRIQILDISADNINIINSYEFHGPTITGMVPNPDGGQLALLCRTNVYLINTANLTHTIFRSALPIDALYYNASGTQFVLRVIHEIDSFSLILCPRNAQSRLQFYPCNNQELNNLLNRRQDDDVDNLYMGFINDGQFILISDEVNAGIHFYQINTPENAIASGWKSYEQQAFFNLDPNLVNVQSDSLNLFTIDAKLHKFYIIWRTQQTDLLIGYQHTREISIPELDAQHNSKIVRLFAPLNPGGGEEICHIDMCSDDTIICQTEYRLFDLQNIHVHTKNQWKRHSQAYHFDTHPKKELMFTKEVLPINDIYKFTSRTLTSLQVLLLLVMAQRRLTHGRRLPRIPPELYRLLTNEFL